ncbi:DUF4298 domain-containing protein [Hutsoniella sourekii]|uniref:DUF4298 domain-containing protein n=1 Tax=Hutsoniella sourekii TaxID=87650 RepID=UPI000486E021|nr:DUF4298 domain-containing protein [Hutsoniella sourekii]
MSIQRIKQMTQAYQEVSQALDQLEESLKQVQKLQSQSDQLKAYYKEAWTEDFLASQAGNLPEDLNQGILTEDTLYNLFVQEHYLSIDLLELALKLLKS